MMADLQIRSVDEGLARQAKARAAQTHRSLSDYLKSLIEADLAAAGRADDMRRVLAEIADDKEQQLASRAETAAALAQVRREMGTQ